MYDRQAPRICTFRMKQLHAENRVELNIEPELLGKLDRIRKGKVTLYDPAGKMLGEKDLQVGNVCFDINAPDLWWPNGFGEASLYTIRIAIYDDKAQLLDQYERRIGLRTLTISREDDEWGQEFCYKINGVKIFAMGADYVPEDNVIANITH